MALERYRIERASEAGLAQLVGWAPAWVVATSALLFRSRGPAIALLWSELLVLGQYALLALACALAAAVGAGLPATPRGRALQLALNALLAAVVAQLTLQDDLSNLLARLALPGWLPGRALVVLLASLGWIGFMLCVECLAGKIPRWSFAVGAGALALGQLGVPGDYPGLHLGLGAMSALLASRAALPIVAQRLRGWRGFALGAGRSCSRCSPWSWPGLPGSGSACCAHPW